MVLLVPSRGWALNRVHNSCQPLKRLFALCNPATLTFDIFDLTPIRGRGNMMENPCVNFGDFTFSRFGFVMRTVRETDRQKHRIMWMIALLM